MIEGKERVAGRPAVTVLGVKHLRIVPPGGRINDRRGLPRKEEGFLSRMETMS